ncbi:MAG: DUF4214 domain-containing protein [Clostridiales bacterium]|nr:DUF4214 domain-containing protein [Clostridiales bacterium]
MKRSLKKFIGTLLTSIALVGVFAGFAPIARVSAAAPSNCIKKVWFSGNGILNTNVKDYERLVYERNDKGAFKIHATIKDLEGECIVVYLSKYNASTGKLIKEEMFTSTGSRYGDVDFSCILNPNSSTLNAAFGGKYTVRIEVKTNKNAKDSIAKTDNLKFQVFSKNSKSFMQKLLPSGNDAAIYPNAVKLSDKSQTAYDTVKKNFKINSYTPQFVIDLYEKVLGRPADTPGANYWIDQIKSKKKTPAQVLEDFLWSAEFQNRCTTLKLKWK